MKPVKAKAADQPQYSKRGAAAVRKMGELMHAKVQAPEKSPKSVTRSGRTNKAR